MEDWGEGTKGRGLGGRKWFVVCRSKNISPYPLTPLPLLLPAPPSPRLVVPVNPVEVLQLREVVDPKAANLVTDGQQRAAGVEGKSGDGDSVQRVTRRGGDGGGGGSMAVLMILLMLLLGGRRRIVVVWEGKQPVRYQRVEWAAAESGRGRRRIEGGEGAPPETQGAELRKEGAATRVVA